MSVRAREEVGRVSGNGSLQQEEEEDKPSRAHLWGRTGRVTSDGGGGGEGGARGLGDRGGGAVVLLADQLGNKAGPTSLVASAHPAAVVAVEVLMERDVVTPVGVAL